MPYCPSCRSEYVDAVTECVDCGVSLVDELPRRGANPSVDLVEVHTAQGELDAQVVRSLLEANGIDCMLSGESIRLTHGFTVDGLAAVKILVRGDDAARARDVIALSAIGGGCPRCGAPVAPGDARCPDCGAPVEPRAK